jgi:hypothetical protein
MKFGFGVHTSAGVNSRIFLIFEEELSTFFSNKSYGEDVTGIIIGVCCMAEEFENFYKKRKPKFTEYKEIRVVNTVIKVIKTFEYELWLNYKKYQALPDGEKKKYFAMKVLDSLDSLDALPKKIKDFDKATFKTDAINFIISKV